MIYDGILVVYMYDNECSMYIIAKNKVIIIIADLTRHVLMV